MSTVVRRTFVSSPERDAHQTWCAIVDLLCQDDDSAREELLSVGGVAASVIADRAPENAPIVVTCTGPRTRIYCLYDDDAIDGSDANEDPLGFNPIHGAWAVSLPCADDDLDWVASALFDLSHRITARALSEAADKDDRESLTDQPLTPNPAKFLSS